MILVTGSSGLIGSEAVSFYCEEGATVVGVDNNMRKEFFGEKGDTSWNRKRLESEYKNFVHKSIDIRDKEKVNNLFKEYKFEAVVHCAAQPSHDKAKEIPIIDFEVNANGTLNLLEAMRNHSPDCVFLHMSTNKVYGDAPNEMPMTELETRYEFANKVDWNGVKETCRVDQCTHSLFGASKLAADVVAQEYGRYFGMNVGVFRGGCLTGPSHSGVELHGFLNYLIKVAMDGGTYTIFGYKGKQVRDNIHSYDVIQAFEAFRKNPKQGAVYNLGGGRANSISMIEALTKAKEISKNDFNWVYDEVNRVGDHICYISDLTKFQTDYPEWKLTKSLDNIFDEISQSFLQPQEL